MLLPLFLLEKSRSLSAPHFSSLAYSPLGRKRNVYWETGEAVKICMVNWSLFYKKNFNFWKIQAIPYVLQLLCSNSEVLKSVRLSSYYGIKWPDRYAFYFCIYSCTSTCPSGFNLHKNWQNFLSFKLKLIIGIFVYAAEIFAVYLISKFETF